MKENVAKEDKTRVTGIASSCFWLHSPLAYTTVMMMMTLSCTYQHTSKSFYGEKRRKTDVDDSTGNEEVFVSN